MASGGGLNDDADGGYGGSYQQRWLSTKRVRNQPARACAHEATALQDGHDVRRESSGGAFAQILKSESPAEKSAGNAASNGLRL